MTAKNEFENEAFVWKKATHKGVCKKCAAKNNPKRKHQKVELNKNDICQKCDSNKKFKIGLLIIAILLLIAGIMFYGMSVR